MYIRVGSKHIDIRYYFSKEASENGDIVIKYLESYHILARIKHQKLNMKMINLKHECDNI